MKHKIELKVGSVYHNPFKEVDFEVLNIFIENKVKRVEYKICNGKMSQIFQADYDMIREMVQHAVKNRLDNYEQTLKSVFTSNDWFDDFTLRQMAKKSCIRVKIQPKHRYQLEDEYFSMTHEHINFRYVDECEYSIAAKKNKSNWAISYEITFPRHPKMVINPNLNLRRSGNNNILANNNVLRLLFEMGFRVGKNHDTKKIRNIINGD